MSQDGNTDRHHRQSLRLPRYDYASAGIYFVTIFVQQWICLFGDVAEEQFVAFDAGLMVESWWGNILRRFQDVELGPYVVMPNHLHGIVMLGSEPNVTPTSLSNVIGWFKTMTTNDYIRGVRDYDWPPFPARLWQRGYYDHIVRNDESLAKIEKYIINNPANWSEDDLAPLMR